GPALPPRGAGGDDRGQHRRRRAGGVLLVQWLEGQLLRRRARARHRRGGVLHPQEDRDQPLLLQRPGLGQLLRREVGGWSAVAPGRSRGSRGTSTAAPGGSRGTSTAATKGRWPALGALADGP